MIIGQAEPGAIIHFLNRRVDLTPTGQFVIGLGRDASGTAQLKVETNGLEEVFNYPITPREWDIQRIEGVPQRTVSPPEEALKRIRREAALVRRARSDNDFREDFLRGFIKPLDGPITGVYGSQRIYNGVPKNPHFGLDIARPTGTLVRAPAAGLVKLVHADMYYSGGTLIIDHGYGISSTFIHLSEILVEEGAYVTSGAQVARVGASGRATGPHLDWRMNWFSVRLDPSLTLQYFSKR
jgi:murein DD-endopeptidase MepM/ murein hydrolase activator NlpD